MAHDLQIDDDGIAAMFSLGGAWHGLGQVLERPATSREAITAARLDWDVVKKPLFAVEGGKSHRIYDRFAVVRADWWANSDKPVYGIVGKDYTPLQNRDAFAFFDDIVGEGAAVYHTAGALGDGERVWILAKLPGKIVVTGDDVTNKYLLLSNSHNGGSSVQIKFTPIRVVCRNTLTLALSQGPTLRVPHTKNLNQRMAQATKLLGIVHKHYTTIEVALKRMAGVQLNEERLERYLHAVFPDPSDAADVNDATRARARARAIENRRWSRYLLECGKGHDIAGVKDTLWAAYNGVTEFIDHGVPPVTGKTGKTAPAGVRDRGLGSIWFGDGYLAKARAFRCAGDLARAAAN